MWNSGMGLLDHNTPEAASENRHDAAEEILVAAARNGDARAFDALTQQHRSSCLKRATSMLRNPADAEDEVQNAFWKAFHRLNQFRGEGTYGAWLNRIVENQCLMHIREERNLRFIYLDELTTSGARIELVGQTADPEDELGHEELVKLMRREISRMPPVLRRVIWLHDVCQLPMPEVALQLGLSIPAAKSRLVRARVELRSRISKHCGRKGVGALTSMAQHAEAAYARAG
jgi:RNA polymerase sigma-70 factor (ECF subfamily)